MLQGCDRQDLTLHAAPLIKLPIRFETDQATEFEDLTNRLFRSGVSLIVLDTREVEIVDSTSVLAVLDAGDRAYSAGVQMLIVPSARHDTFFESSLSIPDNVISLLSNDIELAA